MKIVGGEWLKERNNYDAEMARVNNWVCVQDRHYDVLIGSERYEVKKTKTSGVIVKIQQLAEAMLDDSLSDISYLIVRTSSDQSSIVDIYVVPMIDMCKIQGMTTDLARQVLIVHKTFNCTLQNTVKLKDLEQFKTQAD